MPVEPDAQDWLEHVQARVVALPRASAREHVTRVATALAEAADLTGSVETPGRVLAEQAGLPETRWTYGISWLKDKDLLRRGSRSDLTRGYRLGSR